MCQSAPRHSVEDYIRLTWGCVSLAHSIPDRPIRNSHLEEEKWLSSGFNLGQY